MADPARRLPDAFDVGALPTPTSKLFGREAMLDAAVELVTDRHARLITLVGLGGVGKTRLAIEIARLAATDFVDGVAFVDLAPVADDKAVPDELCRQLGVATYPGQDVVRELCVALVRRDQLIVLDNLEQLMAAGPFLADVIAACPGLVVLATSRRRLQLAGEHVLPVPPLSAEDRSPAVQLYLDRARAVDPNFAADAEALSEIAEICRLLDGLPLAIELAAARSRALRPRQVRVRLRSENGPWSVLAPAPRDAQRHHYGLFEAIQWSLDLLEAPEQELFCRLGVFSGSWSLEAVEQVCVRPDGAGGLDASRVLDALSTLVDLHLVEPILDVAAGALRYRLLETIGASARRLLAASGQAAELRNRHAAFYLELLSAADEGLEGTAEPQWYRRIDADTPNIDAALHELDDAGRGAELSQAVAALGPYWLNCGRFAAGRSWLSHVAQRYAGSTGDAVLACRGWSARLALDGRAASLTPSESAELIAELDAVRIAAAGLVEPRRWLRAVEHLTYALRLYGDAARGAELSEEAVRRCGADELAWWRAEHLLRLSLLHEQLGDGARSRHAARRAAVAAASGGNERVRARAMQAEIFHDPNVDPAQLRTRLTEVLALSEAFGDRRGAVTTRLVLASIAAGAGDLGTAGIMMREAIRDSLQIGYQHGIGMAGVVLAFRAAESNDWSAVADVHAVIARQLPALRRQLPTHLVARWDEMVGQARQQVGASRFDESVALAADGSPARSADVLLARCEEFAQAAAISPAPTVGAEPGSEPLSQRQLEVLGLIADGMTNEQIAERLVLSPKTVMHHSSHIYRKLGVRGRAEAVACAGRLGLLGA